MKAAEKSWTERYLAPLAGAKIVSVGVKVDEDGEWPVLRIRARDGRSFELEVSRDEEGNGPGFLFGLPFPDQGGE